MKKTKLLFCAALFLAAAFFTGCVAPPDEKASEPAAPDGANEPVIGKLAPDFTLTDLNGSDIRLSSFRGNFVILEWINYGCPFVRKHYSTGNMQKLQNGYMEKGVIWLGICSSAPGKQGYFSPEEWKKLSAERNSSPTHILLDPSGKAGKLYRAKTTPEMFIINPDGVLI